MDDDIRPEVQNRLADGLGVGDIVLRQICAAELLSIEQRGKALPQLSLAPVRNTRRFSLSGFPEPRQVRTSGASFHGAGSAPFNSSATSGRTSPIAATTITAQNPQLQKAAKLGRCP
jgi:hypothetical protein